MPEPLHLRVDAQLPPGLARWLGRVAGIQVDHVQDLGLLGATDRAIFDAARAAGVVVATKDLDFVQLLERHGPPPQILWITCGNVTNAELQEIVGTAWPRASEMLASGEPLVEISGRR